MHGCCNKYVPKVARVYAAGVRLIAEGTRSVAIAGECARLLQLIRPKVD